MVCYADHKSAERARGKLHKVDGDDAPGALDAELFKEGYCDHLVGRSERVGVEQGASDDADEDDRESATEDLRQVANDCSSCHSSEIGTHLSDRHSVGAKVVLVL